MKSFFDAIRELLTWPARLSVAARAAFCLVVGLVVLLAGVWVWYVCSPRHIPWAAYMSWSRGAILAALILSVAFAAYWTIRIWLSEEMVDHSLRLTWKAGLREMRHSGIPMDGIPIHLMLGTGTGEEADRLIQASGVYRLLQQPRGAAGFTFSANPQRLCLSAGGVGRLALMRNAMASEIRQWSPDDNPHAAPTAAFPQSTESESYPDSQRLEQTLQDVGLEPAVSDGDDFLEIESEENGTVATAVRRPQAAVARTVAKPMTLLEDPLEIQTQPLWTLAEAAAADQKLHQLANLIRSGRRPVAPINRILIVVPAAVLLGSGQRIAELQRAIRRDLEVLEEALLINAPVTILVSGLEDHPGFVELIRRVGPEIARQQPLGQSMEAGCATTRLQMESLATQTCGQVEDVIYSLLRKDEMLSTPSNAALYRLLCDVRTGLRKSLCDLLVGSFALENSAKTGYSVAGCYFCASGPHPQRTGFVEPVLRLQDQAQDELEWFPRAIERDAWHRQLSRFGWLATFGMSVVCLGLLGTWLSR